MAGDEPTTWQPGDPVHPEQRPEDRQHCGPCLMSWTADVDRCPECGELSTEALRASIGSKENPLCVCEHRRRRHTAWEGCRARSCHCPHTPETVATDVRQT